MAAVQDQPAVEPWCNGLKVGAQAMPRPGRLADVQRLQARLKARVERQWLLDLGQRQHDQTHANCVRRWTFETLGDVNTTPCCMVFQKDQSIVASVTLSFGTCMGERMPGSYFY